MQLNVAKDAVQSFHPLAAAVGRRVPADKVVVLPLRAVQRVHFARAHRRGIFAEKRAAVGVVRHRKEVPARLPARVKGEIFCAFAAYTFVPVPSFGGVEPAQKHIARAHRFGKLLFPRGGDLRGVACFQRAAAQFVAHGERAVAPFRIQRYVRAAALHPVYRLPRKVGRKIPAFERSALLIRRGQRDHAALHIEGVGGRGAERAAVQPVIYGIFPQAEHGEIFGVISDLYGKIYDCPRTILEVFKIIACLLRCGGHKPVVRGHLVFHSVHRYGEMPCEYLRQYYGKYYRRHRNERRCKHRRKRHPSAAYDLHGSLGHRILRDAEVQLRGRGAEVRGERAKLTHVGAGNAALPLGHDIGGYARGSGHFVLPLASCSARRGDGPPFAHDVEAARKQPALLGRAYQPFQRHKKRRGNFAEQRKIGLGNTPLPLRHRLQMNIQFIRQLLLGHSRRLAQRLQPFTEPLHFIPRE